MSVCFFSIIYEDENHIYHIMQILKDCTYVLNIYKGSIEDINTIKYMVTHCILHHRSSNMTVPVIPMPHTDHDKSQLQPYIGYDLCNTRMWFLHNNIFDYADWWRMWQLIIHLPLPIQVIFVARSCAVSNISNISLGAFIILYRNNH